MKHIFYSLLFLTALLSCNNTTSAPLVKGADSVAAAGKQQDKITYKEVSGLQKRSDYSTASQVQKLDLSYQSLILKIRYISDRAYIAMGDAGKDWQPLKINFYYDLSFSDAEKDIHLLLKDNDVRKGYVLFPGFTEEFASYFVYYFEQNAIRYLGNYEATDFNKGTFAFNEQTQEFYRTSDKVSKLTKAAEADRVSFDAVAEDIKLLKDSNTNGTASKQAAISKDWQGAYSGSFLRLKEESADPRAWGSIKLNIDKESAKFYLDSYNENVVKELKVVFADAQKVRFVARDNDKQGLTLLLDKNKYKLSGTLMEEIVGVRETYELEKK